MTPIVIEPEKDFRDALRCEAYIGAMHDYAHARAQETDRPVLQAVRTCLSYAISSRQYCVEQAFHVLYETMIQLDDQQRLFQCALCDAVPQMYKYQVEHDPGCLIPQLWVFQKLDTSSFVHKILTRTDPSRST